MKGKLTDTSSAQVKINFGETRGNSILGFSVSIATLSFSRFC